MKLYNTHNGLKSVTNMRRELARASGDPGWLNIKATNDGQVIAGADPDGFVEEAEL
jgi:hypothetical protein